MVAQVGVKGNSCNSSTATFLGFTYGTLISCVVK